MPGRISAAIFGLVVATATAAAATRPEPPINCADFAGPDRRICSRANAGDVASQAYVGSRYATGMAYQRQLDEAARVLRIAADAGSTLAQINLGVVLATQVLLDDPAMVSACGSPRSSLEFSCIEERQLAEAGRLFGLAADAGDVRAQAYLGAMHVKGWSVPTSTTKGVDLLRSAAARGDSAAQAILGRLYEGNIGVFPDTAEATRLFRLAAEQGDERGMARLAVRLAADKKDLEEALQWAKRAVAINPRDPETQYTLAHIHFLRHENEAALAYAREAALLGGYCRTYVLELSDILSALGKKEEAREYGRRAYDLAFEWHPGLGKHWGCREVKFNLVEAADPPPINAQ
jgi:TPR repeat protein